MRERSLEKAGKTEPTHCQGPGSRELSWQETQPEQRTPWAGGLGARRRWRPGGAPPASGPSGQVQTRRLKKPEPWLRTPGRRGVGTGGGGRAASPPGPAGLLCQPGRKAPLPPHARLPFRGANGVPRSLQKFRARSVSSSWRRSAAPGFQKHYLSAVRSAW